MLEFGYLPPFFAIKIVEVCMLIPRSDREPSRVLVWRKAKG